MKHNSEITAQTRKNLMDAFWDLYCKKGIDKTSVREISDKAGYNRSTFYEYFTDVYGVLEQIEASVLPDIESHQNLLTETDAQPFLRHLTEVYGQNKKYFVVLLGKKGDPSFREKLKDVYKALSRPHLQSLGADDLTLECMLEYATSAFLGVMTYCFTREENPDIEKMVWLLWDFMNDGVMKYF